MVHSKSSPDYVPAVGDVVELRYDDAEWLVLNIDYNNEELLGVVAKGHRWNRAGSFTAGIKLIRHTDAVTCEHLDVMDAYGVADKYFSAPTFSGTYAERQEQWIKHHGIKVGMALKVVRAYKTNEDGYNGAGINAIGFVGSFSRTMGRDGVRIGDCNWHPYFALEPA